MESVTKPGFSLLVSQGRVLSCGMDDGQEQDHYEERLKDVFNSFDTSGCGSLCPEELSDLCQSLHLEDAAPALLHALLQNQDHLSARVSPPPLMLLLVCLHLSHSRLVSGLLVCLCLRPC